MPFTPAVNPQNPNPSLTKQQKWAITAKKNAEKEQQEAEQLAAQLESSGPRAAKVKAPESWTAVKKGSQTRKADSNVQVENASTKEPKKRKDGGEGDKEVDEPQKKRSRKASQAVNSAGQDEQAIKQKPKPKPKPKEKSTATSGPGKGTMARGRQAVNARADSPTSDAVALDTNPGVPRDRNDRLGRESSIAAPSVPRKLKWHTTDLTDSEVDESGKSHSPSENEDDAASDSDTRDLQGDNTAVSHLLNHEAAEWQDSDRDDASLPSDAGLPPRFERRHSRHSSQSLIGLGVLTVVDSDEEQVTGPMVINNTSDNDVQVEMPETTPGRM
ncbi:hypothetical protein HGRIS_001168 [Hohenbuehelia grisea]|uniref:Uncharacterized protein n=1 Tax=Hohenbuehelia grisea TaxID=104357 RepID=A0ABR3JP84_9AGAR